VYSSLNEVPFSYPYKSTGKIIALHILIFIFYDRWKDKILNQASISQSQSALNFFVNVILVIVASTYLKCGASFKDLLAMFVQYFHFSLHSNHVT
jgi:hypothetical protein